MSGTSIVQYKPLVEVEDFHGNKYYSEASYTEMVQMRVSQELIDFSFSGDCVKTSQIVRHRIADPEEVMYAWKTQQLGYWQKLALKAGLKAYQENWQYTKPVTEALVDKMIANIKANKTPWSPISNG